MTWEILNHLSTWACAISAAACAIAIALLIHSQQRTHADLKVSLVALNDAYGDMYKTINEDLQGFDHRIRRLEMLV